MKLYFVTGNKHKAEEAGKILIEHNIETVALKIPEIQGTAEKIITHKVMAAATKLGKGCFTEDVSLHCRALKGLPGPYIKEFVENVGAEGIWNMLKAFKHKQAEAVCTLGYYSPYSHYTPGKKPKLFTGRVCGEIVKPRGKGWGFDPCFQPKGEGKTFAEMPIERKNMISHRKLALTKFNRWLEGQS